MLDAKKNRLDYGSQLKPPIDYEFDYAITTTYSLDLEAILLVPVALFFSEDLDLDAKDIRDDMLEALTNVSKHITIYCQRGKIKVPNTYSQLMAYWEKSIQQIQLPKFDQSFHPKIWIIRYVSKDNKLPVQYRFVNTSRNLTFTRDWDIAITTEGVVQKNENNHNQEIIDMLYYLNKVSKKKIPKQFFEEIPKIRFDTPKYFDNIYFHPIGIPYPETSTKYKNPIINSKQKSDFRLVMSPFLDDKTVLKLNENSKELALFSSEFELSGIKHHCLDKISRKYMFSPFIEEAEKMDSLSESNVEPMNQNLHAKFYIDKKGENISWFIGSANATDPANGRNIEFMVELKTNKYALNPKKMEEQLTALDSNNITLFEPFSGFERIQIEHERIRELEIRQLIHSLSSIYLSGEANLNNDGFYNLKIVIPATTIKLPEGCNNKVKPLPEKTKASVDIDLTQKNTIDLFVGYEETALSPFLLFEIWFDNMLEKRFVLDMKIELSDNRFNKIFSSIINNRSRFLSYLSFLLSEETPAIQNGKEETNKKGNKLGNVNGIAFFDGTPVYEKLLLAASRNPSRLKRIGSLIERLKGEQEIDGKEIISKDFENMWEVFSQFIKHKK